MQIPLRAMKVTHQKIVPKQTQQLFALACYMQGPACNGEDVSLGITLYTIVHNQTTYEFNLSTMQPEADASIKEFLPLDIRSLNCHYLQNTDQNYQCDIDKSCTNRMPVKIFFYATVQPQCGTDSAVSV